MDPVVLKITYCGSLHRLTLPPGDDRAFSYARLQSSARKLTGLPASAAASFTYVDRDGDVVALARDADVTDALVLQGLNPLRITMTRGASEGGDSPKAEQNPEQIRHSVISNGQLDSSSFQTRPEALPKRDDAATEDVVSNEEGPHFPPPQNLSAANREGVMNSNSTFYVAQDGKVYGKSRDKRRDQEGVPVSNGVAADADNTHSGTEREDSWNVVHFSVGCDECGMNPIRGPRFVSYKKIGQNLCSACFKKRDDEKSVHYFHSCNGCDKFPIRGHVFKSLKKSDYDLCQRCFDTRSEFEQGSYMEKNQGFYRCVNPGLVDIESLISVLSISNENECRQVAHTGIRCDECGMNPILGRRCKSYERLDYNLCLACYERSRSGSKDDKLHIHRGVSCRDCETMPIRGPRYNNSRKKVKNGFAYDLCEECFAARDEAQQVGYVEVTRGFYWLVHPALAGNSDQESTKRGSKHGSGSESGQFAAWMSVASSTVGILSGLSN